VIGNFGTYFNNHASTFMPKANTSVLVMKIRSTKTRVCCLHKDLMPGKSWFCDGFGHNGAFGARPSCESDGHGKRYLDVTAEEVSSGNVALFIYVLVELSIQSAQSYSLKNL
jgi:hypothetical protein